MSPLGVAANLMEPDQFSAAQPSPPSRAASTISTAAYHELTQPPSDTPKACGTAARVTGQQHTAHPGEVAVLGLGGSGNATMRANGKVTPAPELVAWLAEQSQRLEAASPREIIAWAVEHYFPRLSMATAFGPEGCVIIHYLAQIEPRTRVFNLDTGYQFKETLELRERILERYGIEVEFIRPELTVAEYEAANGGPVYLSNPDKCCMDRKISLLQRAAAGMDAWMSGIRRDQSPDRAHAAIVGWDHKFGLVKVSPLANWTKQQVWKVITEEGVPYNPLHDQGYPSIGCWPCTRPVLLGEDERAGRWSGFAKTECGLHSR